MIIIKLEKCEYDGREDKKTTLCPKCGTEIKSWSFPMLKCRCCNSILVNSNNLVEYKYSRVAYHKEGPY